MKCVLITNLSRVHLGDVVHVFASAMLLEDRGEKSEFPRFRARMFGTEASDERAIVVLPSIEYEYVVDPPPKYFDGFKVLTEKGTLRIRREDRDFGHDETVEMQLDCGGAAEGRPIDFETFEGDWQNAALRERIWKRLHAKVIYHWHGLFVPVRSSVGVELARKATAGDLR